LFDRIFRIVYQPCWRLYPARWDFDWICI